MNRVMERRVIGASAFLDSFSDEPLEKQRGALDEAVKRELAAVVRREVSEAVRREISEVVRREVSEAVRRSMAEIEKNSGSA